MNLRQFTLALLASGIPLAASAGSSEISLSKGDFIYAERQSRNGEAIVSVKLSKSGKAKLKKLNEHSVDKAVHADIAGVESNFNLREPIRGDGLEMGPYSPENARKVVSAINKQ